MSAERYKIQRLDQGTELITQTSSSNVEPFPVKRWNEPLPIAVEGRPLPKAAEEKPETKSLTRFYPPLLFFSTTLTAVFFYLYLSKPVIVESVGPAATVYETQKVDTLQLAETSPVVAEEEELSPWPEAEALIANELPGLQPLGSEATQSPNMIPTTLGVDKVVGMASLSGELEELSKSLPVLFPENTSSWSEESLDHAQKLVSEIEAHSEAARAIQKDGVELLEKWNLLMEKSGTKPLLTENQSDTAGK